MAIDGKKTKRKTVPLTVNDINKAKPVDKPYAMFDGGGLYLEVNPNGSKIWRMLARLNDRQIKMSFGKYPVVSLQDARKKRLEAQVQIAKGINPNEAKKAVKEAEKAKTEHTFEKIARSWHQNTLPEWKQVTAHDIIRRLERDVFPVIGKVPIADITHQQIIDVLKTVEGRGVAETAKRLKSNIERIFSHAIQRGIIKHNLVGDLKDVLAKANKGHFAVIKYAELPAFLKALDDVKADLQTKIAFRLAMLLFMRSSELLGAEWSEVDLDKGVWVIPWSRMKMGKRKINPDKSDHVIQLPLQAKSLLKDLEPLTGWGNFLFPKRGNPREAMTGEALLRVIKRMGYTGKMTVHGFRALASSWLREQRLEVNGKKVPRFSHDAIERLLSHKERDKTVGAYSHMAEYEEERKEMLQAWADHIDAIRRQNLLNLDE
jgi:integrase